MRRHLWLLGLLAATLACNTLLPLRTITPRPPVTGGPTLAAPTRSVPNTITPGPASATEAPSTPAPAGDTPTPFTAAAATRSPTAASKGQPVASASAQAASGTARTCDYVPGVSVPAQMPASLLAEGTPTPEPPPLLPTNTPVDAATNAAHLRVFQDLISTIQQDYVYTNVVKTQLPGLQRQYRQLVTAGLTDEAFYLAMDDLVTALGDNHSAFESPSEAKAEDAGFAGNHDFVGIGILAEPVPEAQRAVIVVVFPGGPAAEAGLRIHDSIVAIDGQPALDATGGLRDTIRGPEGTSVSLAIQRPGLALFVVKLQRQRVTGALPVDACLIASRRIGYLYLPGMDDETLSDQVRAALRAMTAHGPLAGLIIDNRENGGGLSTVLDALLGLFTHGTMGLFVSRDASRPLTVQPEDVAGSQAVPLVLLVGRDTVSYGELLSGILQVTGRARVIGQRTLGNVETQWRYSFTDGSRVWLAHELFEPPGLAPGFWEGHGIVPDVESVVRWDLFTEGTDPALAAAIDLLSK